MMGNTVLVIACLVQLMLVHANLFFTDKRTNVILNPEVGGRIKLNCKIGGTPKAAVTWQMPDGSAPDRKNRRIRVKKYFLLINNLMEDDSGQYKCVAQGPSESITKNFFITVGDADWRRTTSTPTPTASSMQTENNTRMIQDLFQRMEELSALVHRLEREGNGVHIHINDGAGHQPMDGHQHHHMVSNDTQNHRHNRTGQNNQGWVLDREEEGPRRYYSDSSDVQASERILMRARRDAEFPDDGTYSHDHRTHHMRLDSQGRAIGSDGEELTHSHSDHHRRVNTNGEESTNHGGHHHNEHSNTGREFDDGDMFSHPHHQHHMRYDDEGRPIHSEEEEHSHPHGDHHRPIAGHTGGNSTPVGHMDDSHDHYDGEGHRHYANAEHVYVDLNLKARLQGCVRGAREHEHNEDHHHGNHEDHHGHHEEDHHGHHEEEETRHHGRGALAAHCQMYPNGGAPGSENGLTGFVHMTQEYQSNEINLHFMLNGGPTATNTGFHIHTLGDVSRGCESLGPHYNPHGRQHGNRNDEERHMGDLGNIYFDDNGEAQETMSVRAGSLRDLFGRSIVVHRSHDEFTDGNTGGHRLACCIIGRAEHEAESGN